MLEIFVLFMCASEVECSQLTKAYLAHNKKLTQSFKVGSKKATKAMGKEAALTTAIAYGAVGRHKLRARLPYRFIAEWQFKTQEPKEVTLAWRYDF